MRRGKSQSDPGCALTLNPGNLILCLLLVFCAAPARAAVDFGALGDNDWVQQACSGNGPENGGDVHWAIDTAGYAYMFGGCTYGNGAGGTHNNDVYRFNLLTGFVDHLSGCAGNTLDYKGGCQAPHCYDSKRNCVWTSQGFSSTCGSGRSGLMKFQCPDGPLTVVNAQGGGHYYCYDPVNDLVYLPTAYDGGLNIYNPGTNTWSNVSYPADTRGLESFAVPCCADTKRGLFIMTMWCDYGETQLTDAVWIFNGATRQWAVRTPALTPQFYAGNVSMELAYDALNDKYVYFGIGPDKCTSEVWAYDYATDTWAQSPMNGRSYNDANRAASTWPPARSCHTWAYCAKYNAFASWGGGIWTGAACTDYDNGAQPVWIYRLKTDPSGIVGSSVKLPENAGLDIFPNPFRSSVVIRFPADVPGNGCSVYDPGGRLIKYFSSARGNSVRWDAGNAAAGVYLLRAGSGNRHYIHTLLLQK